MCKVWSVNVLWPKHQKLPQNTPFLVILQSQSFFYHLSPIPSIPTPFPYIFLSHFLNFSKSSQFSNFFLQYYSSKPHSFIQNFVILIFISILSSYLFSIFTALFSFFKNLIFLSSHTLLIQNRILLILRSLWLFRLVILH